MKQAPRTYFEKLKDRLVERETKKFNHNPCIFMKKNMVCVVYVNDTIICGPNGDAIEAEIHELGISKNE